MHRVSSVMVISSYQERAVQALRELGVPTSLAAEGGRPLHEERDDLVSVGLDMFGREQWLERATASQWRAMRLAAEGDGTVGGRRREAILS